MQGVYIEKRDCIKYPDKDYYFSPSKKYPEYPFDSLTISCIQNDSYDMVRSALFGMGLDRENYGKSAWNPLGEYINLNDTVLIKPNFVMHFNYIEENGIDCLVTHPSLIRAVIDYVLIALKGTGEIIIGDAPMQSCDFDQLLNKNGYSDIIDFYSQRGYNIVFRDFRLVKTQKDTKNVISLDGDKQGYSTIDLGKNSFHRNNFGKLRITNYDPKEMILHHNESVNEYIISNAVLKANVIINMPKPKTHRKAGVTISLKNLIGINGHKSYLPHHATGSVTEGGDEYLNKNFVKKLAVKLTEQADIALIENKKCKFQLYNSIRIIFTIISRIVSKDRFSEGSWYGNDTIWKTIADINMLAYYCDKEGHLSNEKQRKLLIIADMIISGEGEGPLMPTPKKAGMIAIGDSPVEFDTAIATIMGFDYRKISSISNLYDCNQFSLTSNKPSDVFIKSNEDDWNGKFISDICYNNTLKFMPSKGWFGHIELE